MNAFRRRAAWMLLGLFLFGLSGCQELQGPVWSPDGNFIAYTAYAHRSRAGGRLTSSIYLVAVGPENPEAVLIAKDAAFPRWVPDGPSLYFLGKPNKQGLYTAVLRYRPGQEQAGPLPYEVVIEKASNRWVNFQLSVDGSVGLLGTAKSTRPGRPQKLEFWDVQKNERHPLRNLGEVYSPALSPNGVVLAYTKQDKKVLAGRPYIATLELDRKPLQPKVIFPTAEYGEPAASRYVIHAFPDSERFLFYAPGGTGVWTVRHDGGALQRYALPRGFSSPLIVSIAEDGRSATLTLAKVISGNVQYFVYELRFSRRKVAPKRLDGPARELLGGHALDPRSIRRHQPPRWAWLSAAGLALGTPGKARYFPKSTGQHLAASAFYIAQHEPAKAVAAALSARESAPKPEDPGALDRAEARAYLAAGEGVRASEAFERSALLYPIGPSGLPWIFSPRSGLPRQAGADAGQRVREMEAFAKANPKDQLLKLLQAALLARVQGRHQDALQAYRAAEQVCPYEALTGGVKFQEAMTAFEGGDMVRAGEYWESAARSAQFPQADYAAGLSAIAFALDGRPSSAQRATRALKIGLDMNTALKKELQALPKELGGKVYRKSRLGAEVKSPDRQLRAWVEIKEYLIPQAFLKPTRLRNAERQYTERRISAALVITSAIQVAGLPEGTKTLLRLPFEINVPSFSPSGKLLAFLAKGEVFPLEDRFCEAYVISLDGTILRGDPGAAQNGALQRREILSALSWTRPRELKLSGAHVDAFGNETLLQRTEAIIPR